MQEEEREKLIQELEKIFAEADRDGETYRELAIKVLGLILEKCVHLPNEEN